MEIRDYEKGCVERALSHCSPRGLTGQKGGTLWQSIISSMPQDVHDIREVEHQREPEAAE